MLCLLRASFEGEAQIIGKLRELIKLFPKIKTSIAAAPRTEPEKNKRGLPVAKV